MQTRSGISQSTRLLSFATKRLIFGVAVAVVILMHGIVHAETFYGKAETSRAARQKAIRDIPFQKLTPAARTKIAKVVNKPSMFRRMPLTTIQCDAELHRFLIRYPEVVVNIWQLMGITKVSAHRIGRYLLETSDGLGTNSKAELVYGTMDVHLYYCEGNYDGPLFRKPLRGQCVLVLKTAHKKANDGRSIVTNCLDVFLKVDNIAVSALTKTLHPLVGKSADVNFIQSMKFLERISQTAEKNGPGVERLASRLEQVDEITRLRFAEISTDTFERNRKRLAANKQAMK